MKSLISLLILLSLTACGESNYGVNDHPAGKDGASCSTSPVLASGIPGSFTRYGGVLITCGTSQSFVSNGPKGNNGEDGTSCVETTVSASGINGTCDQYGGALIQCGSQLSFITNGAPGAIGATGATGAAGSNGSNGTNGVDATPVTTVQFCPNQGNTVYPNNFPEYGVLIGGSIYAVYYDTHNAWFAKIVPGTYMSTATGLQCTFTVNPDNSVTQH